MECSGDLSMKLYQYGIFIIKFKLARLEYSLEFGETMKNCSHLVKDLAAFS